MDFQTVKVCLMVLEVIAIYIILTQVLDLQVLRKKRELTTIEELKLSNKRGSLFVIILFLIATIVYPEPAFPIF